MTDDIVDTLSDACNDITWDAANADPVFHNEDGQDFYNGPGFIGMDPASSFSLPELRRIEEHERGMGGFDSFYYF